MRLTKERILLSESGLIKKINEKKQIDMSFIKSPIELKVVQNQIEDMKLRRYPLMTQILAALASKSITLTFKADSNSSLVFVPVMDSTNSNIVSVIINLSRLAKNKQIVDPSTGDITVTIDIKHEELYNLLFGAVIILNAQKCYMNTNLVKYLRTIYTDILGQIINRSFGNPIYGDKFRYIIGYFFHNGEIKARDFAESIKFDADKASVLESNYPEFFSSTALSIEDLLNLMTEEFPNMKNISMDTFITSAVTMVGESAFYSLDNLAYFLGTVAVKCRKDRLFSGYLLRNIDTDKAQIANLMLQSI